MTLAPRHRVLGIVALATLAGSIWALDEDTAAPAPRPAAAGAKLATLARAGAIGDEHRGGEAAAAPLALPERFGLAVARRDLFAATVSAPASAVVVAIAALPPPAPALPPPITLPFTFAGRLVTAEGPSVLLNDGAVTRVLPAGATLGDFRFERDSGTQLEFVHVPSGERLVLALQP